MKDARTNRRHLLKKGGVLGVLAALLSPASAFAKTAKETVSPKGSWITTVTISGHGAPPPFLALATFHEGGGYVETDQSEKMPPFLGSPGHGNWVSTGERSFAVTFLSLAFDKKGASQGMSKVRQIATLSENGKAYSGSGKFEVFDVHGKLVLSNSFTTQGRHIPVEPL